MRRELVRGRELVVDLLIRRVGVLLSRRLRTPLRRAQHLWALRTWWQQGSRASTDRKNAAVAARARVAPAQRRHGGCERAKAKRNADDSPFAAAHGRARANSGNVETEIERQATQAAPQDKLRAPLFTGRRRLSGNRRGPPTL